MDNAALHRNFVKQLTMKRAADRALLAFIALCGAATIALLIVQNHTLNVEVKNQQVASANQTRSEAAQAQSDAATLRQINSQATEIKQTIQCIGDFFAQPNRQNLTIENIQQCQFNTNAFSPTAAIVPKQTTTPVPKTPTTSEPPEQPKTSQTASTGGSGATSSSGNGGSGVSNPPNFLDRAVTSVTSLPQKLIEAMSGIL
jgi:hypothetical protein